MALVNPGIALGVENFKVPNMLGMAAEAEAIQNAQVNRQSTQQEMERAQYAQALKQSRDALSFVRTPEDYIAWSESNYRDPLLGSFLQNMGMTPDKSRAQIAAELQKPGGLERLIQQSAASADQLGDIMTGRINAMAKQREAAAGQARTAEQQAAVDAIIKGGQAAPAVAPTAPATAPTAQVFPVAPPVDTGVYEPGTSGAINQMYAQSRATPTPALNALTAQPTAAPAAATTAIATTPAAQPLRAGVDPRIAQYQELSRLAMRGNKEAEKALKLLKDELELEYKLLGEKSPLAVINMPQQEKSFEDKVGKEGVKRAYDNFGAAREAGDIIATVETGRDLLNSGMITGAGAEFFVGLNQALKTAGIDFGYGDAAANSQAYAANMAQNVGKIIKQFGAGTGLSDADRQYAEKMAAGKISLDAQALRKILRINEDAARRGIESHNELMAKMGAPEYLIAAQPPFNIARVPPAAVEYLKANPKTKSDFDKMYGYGYADFILGGQNGR